jgi:hypothetical protein
MKLRVEHGDGTFFDAVSDGTITEGGGGGTAAFIFFPGAGYVLTVGTAPTVKGSRAQITATGSKIFVQNFPAPATGPSMSRLLVLEASGGANASALDNSAEIALRAGQYVDVRNSNPVLIGSPQTYNASTLPETATALAAAEEAMEAEDPEP